MVRAAKRPAAPARAFERAPADRRDGRDLERLRRRKRRQQARQALCEHALAAARRTHEQHAVRSRRRDGQGALGGTLAAHIAQVGAAFSVTGVDWRRQG